MCGRVALPSSSSPEVAGGLRVIAGGCSVAACRADVRSMRRRACAGGRSAWRPLLHAFSSLPCTWAGLVSRLAGLGHTGLIGAWLA
eukprot:1502875-Alexandrium_andersonii.AAC.1